MQFKSVLAVSTAVFVAVMGAYGCSSGGGTTDGGKDATSDTKKPDVIQQGDTGTCGSGLTCELCDISGYQTTPQSKPVASVGACTSTEIQAYVTACELTTSTQTTCTTWYNGQPDGGACAQCLLPVADSSANWGPVHCASQTSCFYNFPGCIDLVTNTVSQEKQAGGSGTCGDALSDYYGCGEYACNSCSATDGTNGGFTGSSAEACFNSSDANECKSYADIVNSATGICSSINGDAAPAKVSNCFPQTRDLTNMSNYFDVFCGTGP